MLISKLKDSDNLTYQEKMIVDYIFSHPEEILRMTANDLAAVTYTSASCISRLCKKVGFKNYPAFKIEFAIEWASGGAKEIAEKPLHKEMTTNEIIDLLPSLYHQSYMDTQIQINENIMNRVINYIKKAKRVDIYGESINFYLAQQVCFNLQTLNVNAFAFSTRNEDYIHRLSLNKDFTYSIIISHSGDNPTMLRIAKLLNECNQLSLGIIAKQDSEFDNYCNDILYFSHSQGIFDLYPMRSSCAISYIFDIIFTKILVSKYQDQL